MISTHCLGLQVVEHRPVRKVTRQTKTMVGRVGWGGVWGTMVLLEPLTCTYEIS